MTATVHLTSDQSDGHCRVCGSSIVVMPDKSEVTYRPYCVPCHAWRDGHFARVVVRRGR